MKMIFDSFSEFDGIKTHTTIVFNKVESVQRGQEETPEAPAGPMVCTGFMPPL